MATTESLNDAPVNNTWPAPARAWTMLGVLTLAYILSFVDRMVFGLLIAPIRAEFAINDTVFSLLYGFGFACFYTLLGIPLGWAADRYNRRNLAAVGIAAWSMMTAACGMARSFVELALARIAVGIGEATLTPAAYSIAGDSFPPHKLGRALSVFVIGWPLGIGLALIIGGQVIRWVDAQAALTIPLLGTIGSWRAVFVIVGLPGLLIALLTCFLREPERRQPRAGRAAGALWATGRHLWTHWQAYACLTVGFSMLSIVMNTYQLWGVQYFVRVHAFPIARAGLWVGTVIALFGTLGILTGGWLHDRLRAAGRTDAALRVGRLAALAMLPSAACATLLPDPNVAILAMIPIGFFTSFGFGASGAAIVLLTPSHMRASVSAVYLFVLNMVAMGLGPLLTAALNDHVFESDMAVGKSVAIVATSALLFATLLFSLGLPRIRALANGAAT